MALSVNIKKKLGNFSLDVCFETDNEHLALLGASGCGKSMTLKCIAGIEKPDSGKIVLNGRTLFDSEKNIDLSPQKRKVGYLFQQYALFPNMTVAQNIFAGARTGTRAEKNAIVREKIKTFRLEGLEKKKPWQLSGGQQQRVALARILVNQPEVLLLDEPFSALDNHLKWQLEMDLTQMLHEFTGDVVFVSHSRDEVYRVCDSVCVLTDGMSESKITVQQLFESPNTVSAAQLSGCENITRAYREDNGLLYCPEWGGNFVSSHTLDGPVSAVGVRADYWQLCPTPTINTLRCRVSRIIKDITAYVLILETGGNETLRVHLSKNTSDIRPGDIVCVQVSPEHIMLLK